MKYDPEVVASEGFQRTLSQGSEEAGSDERRALAATLSDPYSSSSGRHDADLPPTGHVRVKANYDMPDLPQEPSRVSGRRTARTEAPPQVQVQLSEERRTSDGGVNPSRRRSTGICRDSDH